MRFINQSAKLFPILNNFEKKKAVLVQFHREKQDISSNTSFPFHQGSSIIFVLFSNAVFEFESWYGLLLALRINIEISLFVLDIGNQQLVILISKTVESAEYF